MVVLHYIPSLQSNVGQASKFVQMLKDVMGQTIVTHIISGNVSRREFVDKLLTVNPDVVHIHGCWHWRLLCVQRWAQHRGYPVILSPHGGLSQSVIQKEFWKKRLPQIIAFQFRVVRKSFVIHASTPQELDDLKSLGWKKRIALINYKMEGNDAQQLTDSFRTLYQKVIDTTLRNHLHVREREALWSMLLAYTTVRHDVPSLTPDESRHLSALTHHNWQSILTYAIDHGILRQVQEGAQALQFTIPIPSPAVPPRYKHKSLFHEGKESRKAKTAMARFSSNPSELAVVLTIHQLYRALMHHEHSNDAPSPIAMLCDIAEHLRWDDIDEAVFNDILSLLGIRSFAGRLMQVLSETFRLTVGFMPINPLNDSVTEKIRRKLDTLI